MARKTARTATATRPGPGVRTFWLSFAEKGKGNLGCAIVEVTATDIELAKIDCDLRFPKHLPGAELISAAAKKAWAEDCNPGGDVASTEITNHVREGAFAGVPRHTLMQVAELRERGLI